MSSWQAANGATVPSDTNTGFAITAPPKTDIWRPDHSADVFTAPYIYTALSPSHFKSVSVTVSGPWKTQFDQGGLILAFPHPGSSNSDSTANCRWIKAGIEFFSGAPALGVVGTDRYSDWSLAEGAEEATFEAVREGTSLWVSAECKGRRLPLREVKWAFVDVEEGGEMWVGVYAAKPTPEEGDEEGRVGIDVSFRDLQVRRSD